MQLLRNILAWMPCGKPQAAHFAHLVELPRWLPERVNFTRLEHCGGWTVRTHARWFARAFPSAGTTSTAGRVCRPGSGRRVPSVPFPCVTSSATTLRRKYTNALAHGRLRADTPPIPRPAAVAFSRNASGCGRPLVNRGRPDPEHGFRTGPAHRLRPQNVSEP